MKIPFRIALASLALGVLGPSCGCAATTEHSDESNEALGSACCTTAPALVTLDPSARSPIVTVSDGDLTTTVTAQQKRGSTRATLPRCSGKWYWEVTINAVPGSPYSYPVIGVGTADAPLDGDYIGAYANGWAYFPANAERMHNAVAGGWGPYGQSAGVGDTIGVALDIDAHTLTFYKNGVSMGAAYKDLPSGVALYPMVGAADMYLSATTRFSAPFAYAPPAGFSAYGGVAPTTWDEAHKGAMISLSPAKAGASDVQQQVRGATRATRSKSSGKWYWEITIESVPGSPYSYPVMGVGTAAAPLQGDYIGAYANGWAYFPANAEWMHDAVAGGWGPYGQSAGVGDVIGVALDIDDHTLAFYKNGVSMGVAYRDIPSGTPLHPMLGCADMYFTASARFAAPFKYPAPVGFAAFDGTVASCH